MIYNNINTNLAGDCYKCLEEGVWEIGLISENPGLDNIQSDYYKTVKRENQNSDHRCFKNKVLIETKKKFPEMILFGLFEKKKIIGYGGLVHISWKDKRAELSLLLDDRINSKNLYQLYSIFIDLSLHLAFKVFKF